MVTAWIQNYTTTLRRSDLLPYINLMPSKCHPAAVEGAQLSTIMTSCFLLFFQLVWNRPMVRGGCDMFLVCMVKGSTRKEISDT